MADVRVSWEWDGKEKVQEHLKKVEDALSPPGITQSLSRGADTIVDAVRGHAPVKSGALRKSIDKKEVSGTEFDISPYFNPSENDRGTSSVVYAAVQDSGATLHPSTQPYMRFLGDTGWVQAREVTVPGTGYMEAGFQEGAPVAAKQVIEDVKKKIDS